MRLSFFKKRLVNKTQFLGPKVWKYKPFFIDTPTEMGSEHPFPHKNLKFQSSIYREGMETLDPSQLSFPLKFNMVLVPIPSEARHFVKIFTSFQSSPLKIREINKFVTDTISSLTEMFKSPLKV